MRQQPWEPVLANCENNDATGNKNSSHADCPTAQDEPNSAGDLRANVCIAITQDDSIQQSGAEIEDMAAAPGVPQSALKRGSEELGVYCQLLFKRKKGECIQSDPKLPTTSVNLAGGEVIKESVASARNPTSMRAQSISIKTDPENDYSCTMIVKATHKEDITKFRFCVNSGIKGLSEELAEIFGLEGEMFKIKYEEEGDWILIARDKELRHHMDDLLASGQTVMELSVFPFSSS